MLHAPLNRHVQTEEVAHDFISQPLLILAYNNKEAGKPGMRLLTTYIVQVYTNIKQTVLPIKSRKHFVQFILLQACQYIM